MVLGSEGWVFPFFFKTSAQGWFLLITIVSFGLCNNLLFVVLARWVPSKS